MKKMRVFAAVALAVLGLGALAAVRGALSQSENSQGPDTAAAVVDAETLVSGADLDRTIAVLQSSLAEDENAREYTALGVAYLQKVRETGDPTYYSRAEGVLEEALEIEPGNFDALTNMGALALARHDFEEAHDFGQEARKINPHNAHNYGVIGDALLELGRYDEAFAAFQTMVDLRPDLSSYARVSYARELTGDIEGAIEAMKQAREAGGPRAENVAYTTALLGNLYLNHGDAGAAAAEYERAGRILADYPPALAGQGRIAALTGDITLAIDFFELAAEINPVIEHVAVLGDLYAAAGRQDDARRQYELVASIAELAEANGVETDLEMALFKADHELELEETLAVTRTVYARRPGVHTADILAWTLYQSGEHAEAGAYANEALKLGSRDPLLLFHAGMIAYANGDFGRALELLQDVVATNPNFSILHAGTAEKVLAEVRSVVAGDDSG